MHAIIETGGKQYKVAEGDTLYIEGKKVLVFKYKPKKNYRRRQGHRQPYTKVEITKVSG